MGTGKSSEMYIKIRAGIFLGGGGLKGVLLILFREGLKTKYGRRNGAVDRSLAG